ncbi:MAG TPA: extracellular solute-binding protein [Syntrophomonadaceae bacterium]|nr:extracellular solute-binding protein [Syntrophomonadaceae bacterium]
MKKFVCLLLAVLMTLALACSAFAANINFSTGGQNYTSYPEAYIDNGVTMVPISLITDILDIDAKASAKNNTLSLIKNDKDVLLDLSKGEIKINGQSAQLERNIKVIDSHTFVPLRQIAAALGAIITWDSNSRTIDINPAEDTNTLTIFHAGSLKAPMADFKTEFLKSHPRARIYYESSGSLDCARKVTEQGRKADIIASADYSVFDQLMIPQYTEWYALLAKNEMVLCYTDKSKFAAEINADNWYQVLTRDGVVYSHTNPDLDPAGYRALMVWQLAESHYKAAGLNAKLIAGCPADKVYNSAADLTSALQAGTIDYAFEYLSVAKQNGFKYVTLPEQINLSSTQYADLYKNAKVTTAGTTAGTTVEQIGQPIVYAITIPKNAPNAKLAEEFATMMLGAQGQAIMEKAGQIPITPVQFNDVSKVPAVLK